MFVANATIQSSEFGKVQIAICTDEYSESQYRKYDTDNYWHLTLAKKEDGKFIRPIVEGILQAAAKNVIPTLFSVHNIQYTLLKYSANSEERFYNSFRDDYVVGKAELNHSDEIYLYSEHCRCFSCYKKYGFDNIVSICATIDRYDSSLSPVQIDLQECTRCRKYFIDKQTLENYESRYGKLLFQKRTYIIPQLYLELERDKKDYRPDSVLSRNGYSTKLSNIERKRCLMCMMDEKHIPKAEIIDMLSFLIADRGHRFPNARDIWESDLEFVNDYKLQMQKKVSFL